MRRTTRWLAALLVGAAAFSVGRLPPAHAASSVTFSFSSAAGGIRDGAGQGTGLPERLPGTGGGLSTNDSNLSLDTATGRLRLYSTDADINGSRNLGVAELLGVRLS
jgi:hypothetical protein